GSPYILLQYRTQAATATATPHCVPLHSTSFSSSVQLCFFRSAFDSATTSAEKLDARSTRRSRLLGPIPQNGYVVRDLEAALKHWTTVLGARTTDFQSKGQPSAAVS